MLIETFAVGALGCNCSIVVDPATKKALVIDPGGDFAEIRKRVDRLGATVTAILHTHTHIDHVGATGEVQQWSGAAAQIHEADRFLYRMLPIQAALVGTGIPKSADLEGNLQDGTCVKAGNLEIEVIHTPGHTPGSVCFLVSVENQPILFAGDTLFYRGIGRTDLWGGDYDQIENSIKRRLYSLSDETKVITGHGPATTIGSEVVQNPFIRGKS